MLCLDDYFVVEVEKTVTEPDTGRKVKKMVSLNVTQFLSDRYWNIRKYRKKLSSLMKRSSCDSTADEITCWFHPQKCLSHDREGND